MTFIKIKHASLVLAILDISAAKSTFLKRWGTIKSIWIFTFFPTAGNPIYNHDDDAFVTFSTPDSSSGVCEAGCGKVVSPNRKGYAVLKPTLRSTRSDYQQLLRPCEGMKCSGIFI